MGVFLQDSLPMPLRVSGSGAENCGLKAFEQSSCREESVQGCWIDLNRISIDQESGVSASNRRVFIAALTVNVNFVSMIQLMSGDEF